MNKNLTDITLVVDRSGSMHAIHNDAEGGVNALIQEQARAEAEGEGKAVLTLVQFDDAYEFVHKGVPIEEAPHYTLSPRGCTALLDAVGRAINETGARIAGMPEVERPGLVVFVIVTDGHENASREFTLPKIKEMIEHQQQKYQWQFTFLGANQDAFDAGGGMGVATDGIANWTNAAAAYRGTSGKLRRMRRATMQDETVDNRFTQEEIEAMNSTPEEK